MRDTAKLFGIYGASWAKDLNFDKNI